MAVAAAALGHEDRLSIVDHLNELRVRLIVSLAALAVAFGFCMWQNHALLHIINKPLATQTQKQVKRRQRPARRHLHRAAERSHGRDAAADRHRCAGSSWQRRIASHARRTGGRQSATGQGDQGPVQGARRQQAGDARDRRAVHDDDRHRADLRLHPRAADHPVPALRLPAAGLQPQAAEDRLVADDVDPAAVHRRRAVRLLRRAAGRRALLSELQQRRVQRARAGESVLPLRRGHAARDGARLPESRSRSSRPRAPGS